MSDKKEQAAPSEEQMSLAAQSQQILDSVGVVISDFQQQWAARFNLAAKEWQLSKQSASMVVILSLMLAAVLSTVWLISNLALGFMLFQAGLGVYILSLCLLVLNISLMLVLWLTIKKLCRNIGFSRFIDTLSSNTANTDTTME